MDIFSPYQHQQVVRVCRQAPASIRSSLPEALTSRIRNEKEAWAAHPNPGAQLALYAIVLLNLPCSYLYKTAVAAATNRARREALANWPQTFRARWIVYYFPSLGEGLQQAFVDRYLDGAKRAAHRPFTLTGTSAKEGRWYTWLTSNFMHADPHHLLSNVTMLWCFGNICTKLPGVNAIHMTKIVVGSSLLSSLASVLSHGPKNDWAACGASGAVCAFGTIAAFGAPCVRVGFDFGPINAGISTWALVGMNTCLDVLALAGLVNMGEPETLRALLQRKTRVKIGHSAHLAGAAFGAIYYLLFLRPQTRKSTPTDEMPSEHYTPAQPDEAPVDRDQSDGAAPRPLAMSLNETESTEPEYVMIETASHVDSDYMTP